MPKVILVACSIVLSVAFFDSSALGQQSCKSGDIFTSKSCLGDTNTPDETGLFELVNRYRKASGQSELRLSLSLSKLANRRILDLQQNMKMLTHSWSNCPYDLNDQRTWSCVIDAPKRLNSGYEGEGYETLYRTQTGKASPSLALEAWRQSTLHNSIILNQGMFKDMRWDEVGVAVDGQYAVLWFGNPRSRQKARPDNDLGLGVSFDEAVAGLSKLLSIEQTSTMVEANVWQGLSKDKKVKVEIFGSRKEISQANLAITVKLETDGKIDPTSRGVLLRLLTNIFPEWTDVDPWIERSLSVISANRSASRTKLIRKIETEMSASGKESIKVSIRPQSKPKAIEIF